MIPAMRQGRQAVRLAAFSVAATVISLGCHVLAGGTPPGPAMTLIAVVIPAVAAVSVRRRRPGTVTLVTVLGAVQLVLHEVFAAGGLHAGGLHAGGHGAGPAMTTAEPSGGLMVALHAMAVVITAVGWVRGEQWVLALLGWLRIRPRPDAGAGTAGPTAVHLPVWSDMWQLPGSLRAAGPVVRRGPPVGSVLPPTGATAPST